MDGSNSLLSLNNLSVKSGVAQLDPHSSLRVADEVGYQQLHTLVQNGHSAIEIWTAKPANAEHCAGAGHWTQ